jgi:hypothetical protein
MSRSKWSSRMLNKEVRFWISTNKYLISFFFLFNSMKRRKEKNSNAVKCLSLLKLTGIMIFRHSDCLSRSWLARFFLLTSKMTFRETARHYRLNIEAAPLYFMMNKLLRQIISARQTYLIITWNNFRLLLMQINFL